MKALIATLMGQEAIVAMATAVSQSGLWPMNYGHLWAMRVACETAVSMTVPPDTLRTDD